MPSPLPLRTPKQTAAKPNWGGVQSPSPVSHLPSYGFRDALFVPKGAQQCLQPLPAGLSQHGAAAQHRVSTQSTKHTIYCQSSRVHPPLQRLRLCVFVCVCVTEPTAGKNGSALDEPLLVPMLLGRQLQCPEGSKLDSQVLQHCRARTSLQQQLDGRRGRGQPHHPQSTSLLLN